MPVSQPVISTALPWASSWVRQMSARSSQTSTPANIDNKCEEDGKCVSVFILVLDNIKMRTVSNG